MRLIEIAGFVNGVENRDTLLQEVRRVPRAFDLTKGPSLSKSCAGSRTRAFALRSSSPSMSELRAKPANQILKTRR